MGNAAETFNNYLAALTGGKQEQWSALIGETFDFHGPLLQSQGKAAFVEGASQLCPIIRGYKMLKQWEDGDEVCSIFDFNIETPLGKGTITMSEWTTVRDGKMVASRLIFNTPDMVKLMPPPAAQEAGR